jgi:hypothetical protein
MSGMMSKLGKVHMLNLGSSSPNVSMFKLREVGACDFEPSSPDVSILGSAHMLDLSCVPKPAEELCSPPGEMPSTELEVAEEAKRKLLDRGITFTLPSLLDKVTTLKDQLPSLVTRNPDSYVSFAELWRCLGHYGPMDADFVPIASACIWRFMQRPEHLMYGDWCLSERVEGTCFEGLALKK